jgi:hypothetical protein
MTRCLLTGFHIVLTGLLAGGSLMAPGYGADLKQDLKQGLNKSEAGIKKGSQKVEQVVKSGAGSVKSTFNKGSSKTKKSVKGFKK